MDITTVAAWTALCMQCAPNVHPATTVAIVKVESGGNPFAIGDNNTKKSYSPKTQREAVLIAYELLKKGHSIDMGLMQVNSTHLKNANFQYYDLFDPCFNLYKGSQILSEFYNKHNVPNQNPQTTLLKALSSYNTGNPFKGYYNGYVSKILKNTNSDFVYFNMNAYNAQMLQEPSKPSSSAKSSKYPVIHKDAIQDDPLSIQEPEDVPSVSKSVQERISLSFNNDVKTVSDVALSEGLNERQFNGSPSSLEDSITCIGEANACTDSKVIQVPHQSFKSGKSVLSIQSNQSLSFNKNTSEQVKQ